MSVRELLKSIAAVLSIGIAVSISSSALAQTARAPGRPSSVLGCLLAPLPCLEVAGQLESRRAKRR